MDPKTWQDFRAVAKAEQEAEPPPPLTERQQATLRRLLAVPAKPKKPR
jgi:hypothetical protein